MTATRSSCGWTCVPGRHDTVDHEVVTPRHRTNRRHNLDPHLALGAADVEIAAACGAPGYSFGPSATYISSPRGGNESGPVSERTWGSSPLSYAPSRR